ncbi:MAG: glycosyltransferase family 4 protein [Nanoarchaeota archaeon]|nr:glycosyltransferase family 4 protein [Nanoarchaeota archaeon]
MKTINFAARNYYPDSPGGCEKVFYEIYKRAIKDYSIRIISSYENEKKFPENKSIFPKISIRNKLIRYFYYALNLSLRAKNKKSDLIHANNIECIRLSKTPFVLSIHHVGHFIDPSIRKQTLFNKLMKRVLVWQANRADKVITVSQTTYNDLLRIGVNKEKIIVIPNGVDLKLFKPVNKKSKKFVISHVSRISPEKAQHFTINAIKNLPDKIRDNIELRIIGQVSDKDYFNILEKNSSIKYYTNLRDEDFAKRIAESDLVVFPTMMSEGFGLVVLEAMACSVPVIASRQESIKEAGGDACEYFTQGDEKDFIKKILKIYKSPSLRKKLVRKGLKRAEGFSWDNVYLKHKEVYEELMK